MMETIGTVERQPKGWLQSFKTFITDIRIQSKEVPSLDGRGAPLKLWRSQEILLEGVADALENDIRHIIVLKGRQQGISTVSLAITLFWTATHRHLRMAHVTDSDSNASRNRSALAAYTQSFPEGYFGDEFRLIKNNKQFMLFSNGSRIDFLVAGVRSKTTTWAQGQGYVAAHLTESANYASDDGIASFLESMAQDHPDRFVLEETVANGRNHFYTRWQAARKDPFKKTIFIGWWANPLNRIEESDPRWPKFGPFSAVKEEKEKIESIKTLYGENISKEQLAWIRWRSHEAAEIDQVAQLEQNQPWTEHDAFITEGASFFPTRMIGHILKDIDNNPESYAYQAFYYKYGSQFFDLEMVRVEDEDDLEYAELKVWEEPDENENYVIGFDPAYGRTAHKDNHCISIWKAYSDKLIQVAEYRTCRVDVKQATWALAHLAGAYSNCIINVELTGPGRLVMTELDHIKQMLAMREAVPQKAKEWDDALGNARWYLYHRPDSMGAGYAFNHECTWRTQQELMHGFRGAFTTQQIVVSSAQLAREMLNVIIDGHSIGAPESRSDAMKDDCVFAAALAARAWNEWLQPELISEGKSFARAVAKKDNTSPQAEFMNNKIYAFLAKADEEPDEQDEDDKWLAARSLI